MKERPILFSAPMVRAILAGTKTQTRRLLTPQPFSNGMRCSQELGDIVCHNDYLPPSAMLWKRGSKREPYYLSDVEGDDWSLHCPYGQPGDRLWVRETWGFTARVTTDSHDRFMREQDTSFLVYRADVLPVDERVERSLTPLSAAPWRPSIHMPRWASRILLEVTSVRVERLTHLSEDDARAEGVTPHPSCIADRCERPHRDAFLDLWDSLNGKRAPWRSNPWVWVVSFKRLEA